MTAATGAVGNGEVIENSSLLLVCYWYSYKDCCKFDTDETRATSL